MAMALKTLNRNASFEMMDQVLHDKLVNLFQNPAISSLPLGWCQQLGMLIA
jgi:hypothetical protein